VSVVVAPKPQPTSQQPQQPSGTPAGAKDLADAAAAVAAVVADSGIDYTKIPQQLEKKYEELDVDGALRPTIIAPGNSWSKRFQKTLLSAPESSNMGTDEQGKERTKCFDLLDALTKSGVLSIDYASLHVVIAATHCFAKALMNTVIQDNVNPIEKLERSSLIVASTIHNVQPEQLIAQEQLERVATYSPMLIEHKPAPVASELFSVAAASPVKK